MSIIDELDENQFIVWHLAGGHGAIPPYQMQIVMKDGSSYFVHSGNGRNEETRSVCINVWDLRAIDGKAQAEILSKLSEHGEWEKVSSLQPYDLHQLLSVGRLRCNLDEISHTVEWWSRVWLLKDKARDPLGFILPDRQGNS
jgi:hypothetical protein